MSASCVYVVSVLVRIVVAQVNVESPAQATGGPPGGAAADESRYLHNIRQLTDPCMGLQKAGEAYFSPDGQTVIFQGVPAGDEYYQIYTLALTADGKPKKDTLLRVSTGAGACTCAFFRPDAKKIIFASSHLDPRLESNPRPEEKAGYPASGRGYQWMFNEYMDIFEANPDGTGRKRLTDAKGYDAEGSYSPDGKLIVFSSGRTGDMEVFIMNADGSQPRQITHAKGYDGGPFFSPDGQRIVYRSDRKGDGNMQIFTNNLEGTDEKRLTDNSVLNWCPYWHPSGKYMVFTEGDHSSMPPKYDLWLLRADGTGRTQLTTFPGFDGLPVFSPDGKRLMWTSKRGPDNTAQIFLADYTPPPGF